MDKREKTYRYYDAFGTIVRFCFNSSDWETSFKSIIAIPEMEPCTEDISISLFEIDGNEIDVYLPIPGDSEIKDEGTLILDHPVKFTKYDVVGLRINDYEGYARVVLDYEKGTAHAYRYRKNGITSYYSDLVLGFNGLMAMLQGAGFFGIHASCVDIDGKGVIFTGKGGRGKSTSCYALARRGHPVLSDEKIVLLKKDGFMAASLSDIIKLRKQAIDDFFPELSRVKPFITIEGESYYKAGEVPGLSHKLSTTANSLIILEKTGLPSTRLERVHPAEVVGELFPVTMSISDSSMMGWKFDFLMDFLSSINCYRAYFGTDMDDFGTRVEGLVR